MPTIPEFTNYSAALAERFCIGYASISFRKTNDAGNPDELYTAYQLNSYNDGWFRKDKDSGIAAGYGLCIISAKITGRKPQMVGQFLAYKAKIDYINY